MKKYIKLEDGRVLDYHSKVKIVHDIKDGVMHDYIEEWNEEGTAIEYAKIIGECDYLHECYDPSPYHLPNMEIVLKYKASIGIHYETYFEFDEKTEHIIDDDMEEYDVEEDDEVLLGSWYDGGMRFVAKWDKEKKEWVLI